MKIDGTRAHDRATELVLAYYAAFNRGDWPGMQALLADDIVHDDASPLRAEVAHKAFRGADILYTLRLAGGAKVLSLVPSHHNHAIGERIGIRLDVDHVVTFPLEDGTPTPVGHAESIAA